MEEEERRLVLKENGTRFLRRVLQDLQNSVDAYCKHVFIQLELRVTTKTGTHSIALQRGGHELIQLRQLSFSLLDIVCYCLF